MNYAKLYNKIVNRRLINNYEGYTEEHHIIPRSLGGTDDKNNLVKLTAKEHFICHLLLTKIYEKDTLEYYKMCHAFLMMMLSSKNQQRYFTAKKYEYLRTNFAKRMSILQNGKNNSQYGTIWVHHKELKQCKKVPKDSILEEGWVKGRIIVWDNPKKIKPIKQPKEKQTFFKKCSHCGNVFTTSSRNKVCCSLLCSKTRSATFAANKCKKKVIMDGIIYDSVNELASILGITPEGVAYRIKHGDSIKFFTPSAIDC